MRVFIVTVMLLLLGACQALPQAIGPRPQAALDAWLNEASRLMAYTEEQAQAELKQPGSNRTGQPQRQFRYALLNQQLKDSPGWIRARDSLQRLSGNARLSDGVRQLIRLLQFHNQSMINADARQTRLLSALQEEANKQQATAAALQQSQQQAVELIEKMQALTDLEKSMNIRRALTTDIPGEADDD